LIHAFKFLINLSSTNSCEEPNIKAGTSYLALRVKWAGGDVTKGLEGYGTGQGYADGIIKCEACLQSNCGDNQSCLNKAKE
jgi:hypothetical protein